VSPGDGQGFSAIAAPAPPARTPPPASDSDSGPPAWLLTIPGALIAAFGIWYLRRRPRELGA
jgi:hypothetical protein